MGNVIPDRFFWALPDDDEAAAGDAEPAGSEEEPASAPRNPRHVH
jgi:hydroxymethylpyrimidine/phosphomethylpyrimidine kinase